MEPIKEQLERSVGDAFFEWFNQKKGTKYCYATRPDRAPDLIYSSESSELLVEVTSAYYDDKHAIFLWKGYREAQDAPPNWAGVNPNISLATAICERITDKSQKRYGSNTILLIEVPPGVTTAEDLELLLIEKLNKIETTFIGIYVVGNFPITPSNDGGYRVIPIKEL